MRLRWYADNSEMIGWRGAVIQDVFLYGGIAVPDASEAALRQKFEETKAKYCHHRAPVKWNFKDLEKRYKSEGREQWYAKLLACAQDWRAELVRGLVGSNVKIFLACVESYSLQRKIIKLRKQSLAQYAFANALQRLALYTGQTGAAGCDLTLDWPDKGDPHPFCREYATAFNEGKTSDGHPYHAGALSSLGFCDTPSYALMENCALLQLTDLVVGAVREYVDYALGKRTGGLGTELTRELKSLFYGAPDHIYGWGLVVAGQSDFRQRIREKLAAELV